MKDSDKKYLLGLYRQLSYFKSVLGDDKYDQDKVEENMKQLEAKIQEVDPVFSTK